MNVQDIEIILVEDNPDDAALTLRAFKSRSLFNSFIHLKNGQEAIDYLEQLDLMSLPNLIVLDLNMPILSGTQTLLQIKNNKNLKSIPVIIFSTSANENEKRKCLSFGAVDYLVKPSNYADGRELIQKFLTYLNS